MSNSYQKNCRCAQPDPLPGEVAVPVQVIVSMAEIAEAAKEHLEIGEVSDEQVAKILSDAYALPPGIAKAATDAMGAAGAGGGE